MINGIRLRLKLENLLTYLRNKCCTWQVISLLSLKGLEALSKQESDSCCQNLCVKTELYGPAPREAIHLLPKLSGVCQDHRSSFSHTRHDVPQPRPGVGLRRQVWASKRLLYTTGTGGWGVWKKEIGIWNGTFNFMSISQQLPIQLITKVLVRKPNSPSLPVPVCIYACHSAVTLTRLLCVVRIIGKNFNYASEDISSQGDRHTHIFHSNFP